MKIKLFTTVGCHLCEQAAALINEYRNENPTLLEVEAIDIADNDDLVECYGIRIPVVLCDDKDSDLGWPFSKPELAAYLAQTP